MKHWCSFVAVFVYLSYSDLAGILPHKSVELLRGLARNNTLGLCAIMSGKPEFINPEVETPVS